MKQISVHTVAAVAAFALVLASCSALERGMEGNIYEKMTIFSMIAFTIFAIIFIPFTSKSDSGQVARYRELIRNAKPRPLSAPELTGHPVYVWESRKSFFKMIFAEDGSLSQSPIIAANGQDPPAAPCGTWALDQNGGLQLRIRGAAGSRDYSRISPGGYRMATLMRLKSGFAEAWYLGEGGLAQLQIACFGYAGSQTAAGRFTKNLISGATVFWGSYPCFVPASASELSVNPELAFGMITFHEDGKLSKSVNNPLDAVPDFKPSFTGAWKVDEKVGVLNLSVGLYSTEVTLLVHDEREHALLVGTTAGTEQWFLDQGHAGEDLANYLAIGIYLDERESFRFRG